MDERKIKNLPENFIKSAVRAAVLLICGIAAGYLLMILVFLLPTKPMQANVSESLDIFATEREYHRVIPGYISTQLDNYTDSWMVGNAVFSNEHAPVWERALTCTRAEYGAGPLDGLLRYLSGEDGYGQVDYTRYWHGYLVVLKPLFLLFDYADLRVINIILEFLLSVSVFLAFYRRGFCREGMAYVLSLLFIMPVVVPLSIQFSVVFYIANAAMLVLLKRYGQIEGSGHMLLYFQCIGMITGFGDFLTYPIATLGMPMICLILLEGNADTGKAVSGRIKRIICGSVSWGFGYGAMWAGKWILGTVVLGDNMIADALSQVLLRSSHEQEGERIGIFDIWLRNVEFYFEKPYLLLIGLGIPAAAAVLIRNRKNMKRFLLRSLPFIVTACMPFAWYAFAGQHSYEHHWFTFRGLIVSVFAGLCILAGV